MVHVCVGQLVPLPNPEFGPWLGGVFMWGGAGRGLSPSHKQQNPWWRETFDLSEFPIRSTQHCDPMHEIPISIASRSIEFSDFDSIEMRSQPRNYSTLPEIACVHTGNVMVCKIKCRRMRGALWRGDWNTWDAMRAAPHHRPWILPAHRTVNQ